MFLYMNKQHIAILLFIISISVQAQTPEIQSSVQWGSEPGTGFLYVNVIFPKEFHQTYNPDFFNFEVVDSKDTEWGELIYDEGIEEDGFIQFYDRTTLKRSFHYTGNSSEISWNINVKYQLCDESGICLLPQNKDLSINIEVPKFTQINYSDNNSSYLLYILLAFIGGILLNFMPCVLPLLSVKALNLVHQQNKSSKSILWNSWAYALGILVSMLILALVVSVIQRSGKLLGWGFQFQNPWFILILMSLIFAFSLSLFEGFIIKTPVKSNQKRKEGYGGSFVTGIFAVLVATPCTAPFMGTALGFAFSQPPTVVFLILGTMGMGFSLPFLLLGLFPSVVNRLPKPGHWMLRFQKIMGFVLMGTVLYLMQTLFSHIGDRIWGVFWFLLSLAFALWILGITQNPMIKKINRLLLYLPMLIIPLLTGIYFLDLKPTEGQLEKQSLNTYQEPFSPERLNKLLDANEAVFLEFTADWCTTCKRNHRNVLDKEEIQNIFMERNIYYLVGDYTLEDEVIARWLRKFGRAGVPLYVFYQPGSDPYILPELLNIKMMKDLLLNLDA